MTAQFRKLGMTLGLVVALTLVASCSTAPDAGGEASQTVGRQMYSPDVRGDPYARTQWEASVQALERDCRDNANLCEEAAQARLAISRKSSRY